MEGFTGTYPILEMQAWRKQVYIPFTRVLEGVPRRCYSWGRFLGAQRGVFGTRGSSLNHTLGQWEVTVGSSCSLNNWGVKRK